MFKDELKRLRIDNNYTQEDLAKRLDVSKSTISMYESGSRIPGLEMLETIADFFNVDMNRLTSNGTPTKSIFDCENIIPLPKMKQVPLLGTIACGEPILADENIEDYIKCPTHINADYALRCKGDSMINARIFNGDIIFVRQQSDVDDGEIAAVLIDNEATLKRVYKFPNKVILRAENPMENDRVYTDEDLEDVRIIGKAIYFLSEVR